MNVRQLKEFLSVFPEDMQVLTQTCEGDLLSPVETEKIWLTEAFVDERYGLEKPKLVITAFVKGRSDCYVYKNDKSGYQVLTEEEIKQREQAK